MSEFMRYPIDNGVSAWLPYNYCALPKLLAPGSRWLGVARAALRPFCGAAAS